MNIKYIKRALFFIPLFAFVACDNDPYFEFKGENRIYFQFLRETNAAGIILDRLQDSLTLSLFNVDQAQETYDLWLKVRVTGDTPVKDRKYSVAFDDKKSSSKEGIDFISLDKEYTFRAGSGIDSLKITINMAQARTALQKTLFLNLVDNNDLKIGFPEYRTYKIYYTAQRPKPGSWLVVEHLLGEYHFLKYEKFIELSGSEDFGSYAYRTYYAKKVAKYFSDNVVICPVTGERILCV